MLKSTILFTLIALVPITTLADKPKQEQTPKGGKEGDNTGGGSGSAPSDPPSKPQPQPKR